MHEEVLTSRRSLRQKALTPKYKSFEPGGESVCPSCHISDDLKITYRNSQQPVYTTRTKGARCDACRKWRQRKGGSINSVILPNGSSLGRDSVLDIFKVLHIVGVVKVQDTNDERRLRIVQSAQKLVNDATAYNEGWVELRSSTGELQRRALQV